MAVRSKQARHLVKGDRIVINADGLTPHYVEVLHVEIRYGGWRVKLTLEGGSLVFDANTEFDVEPANPSEDAG